MKSKEIKYVGLMVISQNTLRVKRNINKEMCLRVWNGRGSNISFQISQPPSFTHLNDKTCNSVSRGEKK